MTAFDPLRIRPWVGPAPDPPLRQLLAACLADPPLSQRRWQDWLNRVDFEHENGAGFELAALAAARLGKGTSEGSVAARCLGLQRRSWLLSGVALRAAAQIGAVAASHGITLLARGDLASHLGPVRCGGQPLPIRRLDLVVVAGAGGPIGRVSGRAAALLQRNALEGAAGEAVRAARLPFQIHPLPLLGVGPGARPSPLPGVLVPDPAEHLVELIVQGWRRHPPAGLRWIVELTQRFQPLAGAAEANREELAARMGAALRRRGELASGEEAVRALLELEGTEAVAPLHGAIQRQGPPGLVSRWRRRRRRGPRRWMGASLG